MIRLLEGKEKNLLKHHPWVFSGAISEVSVAGSDVVPGANSDVVPGASAETGVQRVETSEGRFVA